MNYTTILSIETCLLRNTNSKMCFVFLIEVGAEMI